MSNRILLKMTNRKRRRTSRGGKSGAVNEIKRAERAAAEAAGYPSRKRFLRAVRRQHKGEPKPNFLVLSRKGHGESRGGPFLPTTRIAESKSVTLYLRPTLERMKVADLKSLAKERKLDVKSKAKKADIVAAILADQDNWAVIHA